MEQEYTPLFNESLPLRTKSIANIREHWAKRSKRTKNERHLAKYVFSKHYPPKPIEGSKIIYVKLTRVAPRKLDTDNLAGSLKAVRDGIADWLKIDDGSSLVSWEYSQRRAGVRIYGVDVEVGLKDA